MMRLVLVVEETGWFYGVHASVSEVDDKGDRTPVMTRDVVHGKNEEDGLDGLLSAVKAVLFA